MLLLDRERDEALHGVPHPNTMVRLGKGGDAGRKCQEKTL